MIDVGRYKYFNLMPDKGPANKVEAFMPEAEDPDEGSPTSILNITQGLALVQEQVMFCRMASSSATISSKVGLRKNAMNMNMTVKTQSPLRGRWHCTYSPRKFANWNSWEQKGRTMIAMTDLDSGILLQHRCVRETYSGGELGGYSGLLPSSTI